MWSFAKWAGALFLALFLAALATPPETAKSNLSGWVKWIYDGAQTWIIPNVANYWGWALFTVLTAAYLFVFWRRYIELAARGLLHRKSFHVKTTPVPSLTMVVHHPNRPFSEAARIAFETIQGGKDSYLILGLNKGALERLGYFQYEMLAHNLKMFGKPPPSSVPIQIPQPELDQLHPVKGEDKLMDLFEQEPRYVDVAVDGDDFAKYLEDLRRRFPT